MFYIALTPAENQIQCVYARNVKSRKMASVSTGLQCFCFFFGPKINQKKDILLDCYNLCAYEIQLMHDDYRYGKGKLWSEHCGLALQHQSRNHDACVD